MNSNSAIRHLRENEWLNLASERLSHLPKVTQLLIDNPGFQCATHYATRVLCLLDLALHILYLKQSAPPSQHLLNWVHGFPAHRPDSASHPVGTSFSRAAPSEEADGTTPGRLWGAPSLWALVVGEVVTHLISILPPGNQETGITQSIFPLCQQSRPYG